MRILALSLLALLLALPAAAQAQDGEDGPFSGHGMWIWQVPRVEGGDPDAIAERALDAGIDTLIIKGAHGATPWSQFSPELVETLQSAGLTVCAYQRLQGEHMIRQAKAAEVAVSAGADCFVIDAEVELVGRYGKARRYVKHLRHRLGEDFPVGFTSFAYVELHPLVPYSVFLGEGGATVNLPQIYWKAFGDRPGEAFARTVAANHVYGRPLAPIGQLYETPSRRRIRQFRRLALAHGVEGLSWWSWDSAHRSGWRAITRSLTPPALPAAEPDYPTLRPGARSDYVVWAKMHLRDRGYDVSRHTRFDARTERVVRAFQVDVGLPVTGALDPDTWSALLAD